MKATPAKPNPPRFVALKNLEVVYLEALEIEGEDCKPAESYMRFA